MTKELPSSEPHRRTRKAHATETAEDYVEAIAEILGQRGVCRLKDLAERFAVSHVTVHRIVERLTNEGLISTEPYQPLTLTAAGSSLAERCRQRHEIVYRFLVAIGVDEATAAVDAEGIEHHVSPETLRQFESVVNERQKSEDVGSR
ncbi:manganese-binding transcriptional regulator MntR [Thalassoroseus pseudoceratinae]|uniref:manganese-binding transcriptional regulator MntR n=1 Tax=Thalassoroseus pseudoceratinae TaxID=2713176 RepID=UPI001423BF0C|nr:manganese-binding transcriptional regulator MntR [Thalassoroseus pseudoceratinae]